MSTEYVGSETWPLSITVPTDDDEFDVASVDVPLEQLRDGEMYLKAKIDGGVGFEFHDAILHGATNFADGSIDSTLDSINLNATSTISIDASTDLFLHAGQDFLLQANRDALMTVFRNLAADVSGTIVVTGADSIDLLGGVVAIVPGSPATIELAGNVNLGGGTSDTIEVRGSLAAMHNATFAAGKTVALNGATSAANLNAASLRGTVSDPAGITFTGTGHAHWRSKELVDADFAGGQYLLDPYAADFFYLDAMAANRIAWLVASTVTPGSTIEISMVGLTPVGRTLEIYDEIGGVLLCTMSPNTIPYTRWVKKTSGGWRRLA